VIGVYKISKIGEGKGGLYRGQESFVYIIFT
jgi:hypothetical protein